MKFMNSPKARFINFIWNDHSCKILYVAIVYLFNGSGDVTSWMFFGVILSETSKCAATLDDLFKNKHLIFWRSSVDEASGRS